MEEEIDDVMEDMVYFGVLGTLKDSCRGSLGEDSDKPADSDYSTYFRIMHEAEVDPDFEEALELYGGQSPSFSLGSMSDQEQEGEGEGEEEEGDSFVESNKRNLNKGSKRVNAKEVEIENSGGGSSRKGKSKLPENVKKKRKVSENLKAKVPENVGVSSGSKTVRRKGNTRDVPDKKRNSVVYEDEVKEEEVEESMDKSYAKVVNSPKPDRKKLDREVVCSNKSDRVSMDDESSSDVEILAFDSVPFCEDGHTPFVSSKRYESLLGEDNCEGINNSSQSHFREHLMNLLRMPYDGKELDNLWREVTCKKPVEGIRDLRGGRMKLFATKIDGKSYLEWFDDLRMKIDEVSREKRKTLYLLRGFFFWLKNTAHEDAFKPWLDRTCLSALKGPEI